MKLYLNDRPRTFIIVSGGHALLVRHPFPTYAGGSSHHNIHLHHHHHPASGEDQKKSSSLSSASKGSSTSSSSTLNKVIVEFVQKDSLQFSNFRDITPNKSKQKQIFGFLGLLNFKSNIYLGFITSRSKLASPIIGEDIYTITGVDFYCLNNDEYDHFIGRDIDDQLDLDHTLATSAGGGTSSGTDKIKSDYPAASIRRLLSSGSFYYSSNFDITSNFQERSYHKTISSFEDDSSKKTFANKFHLISDNPYFRSFMWNSFMNSELIEFRSRLSANEKIAFDTTGFLTTITRGYAQTVNTVVLPGVDALLTIISKQSCCKNGPLFGDWGCDDSGDVSNFVETEVLVYTEKFCFSYIIVRGNVPIFWEVEGNFHKKTLLTSKKSKKIVYPRSFEASQHAFSRHFEKLNTQFNEVHIVNALTDDTKTYKGDLNVTFKEHIIEYNRNGESLNTGSGANNDPELAGMMRLTSTSLPVTTSTIKKIGYNATQPTNIVSKLYQNIIDFGAFFYDFPKNANTGKQLGVFRINSFDSLSKANFLSKIISQEVIELALRDVGIDHVDQDLLVKHGKLWHENDDQLTKLTLNFVSNSTKLHKSSAATTKGTIRSHLTKKYISGVVTEPKPNEMAMLKLLGKLQDQVNVIIKNPIHDYVTRELKKNLKEFSSFQDISIFSTTFNVNGAIEKDEEVIRGWLYPEVAQRPYDVVFVGFQEIVELTTSQMVNTHSSNRLKWIKSLKVVLEKYSPQENTKYVSLWDGQLGGIALLLFVKESELKNIANVEGSFKKTGLGGMSANKGGVSVSFNFSNTQICLVTSHLAAGLNNQEERHHNYKTIAKGIKFSKNRRIKDHDIVIWLGDFNYRISTISNEQVKMLVEKEEFAKLFEYDQLNKQMAIGELFPFFDEMEIKFPPTYKFDNGTKTYDTSEKQRAPAWTDRILSMSKSNNIKQLYYDCYGEIIFSDHRPVLAIFKVSVNIIDEHKKSALADHLHETFKKDFGSLNDLFFTNNNNINISYILNGDEDDNILPPPSSEKSKWWIDGGLPAKIYIQELENNSGSKTDVNVINPHHPINPFEETGAMAVPEFVRKRELMKEVATK